MSPGTEPVAMTSKSSRQQFSDDLFIGVGEQRHSSLIEVLLSEITVSRLLS